MKNAELGRVFPEVNLLNRKETCKLSISCPISVLTCHLYHFRLSKILKEGQIKYCTVFVPCLLHLITEKGVNLR